MATWLGTALRLDARTPDVASTAPQATNIGGKLVVFGGFSKSQRLNDVHFLYVTRGSGRCCSVSCAASHARLCCLARRAFLQDSP